MDSTRPLDDLIRRALQDTDPDARNTAAASVANLLHVFARAKLGTTLRARGIDSMDVAMSVVGDLLRQSEPQLNDPQHAVALLHQKVRQKIGMYKRSAQAAKRGGGRAHSPLVVPDADGHQDEPADPDASPADEIVERVETLFLLDDAVRQLDDADERLIRLWLRGVPYREIADTLRLSEPNARKRLQRVRASLSHAVAD